MPFNMSDAMLVATQATACSEAHVLLARQNKEYMKFLKKLTTISGYGAMLTAHLPLIMGILANHGITVASLMGGTTQSPAQEENRANGTIFTTGPVSDPLYRRL